MTDSRFVPGVTAAFVVCGLLGLAACGGGGSGGGSGPSGPSTPTTTTMPAGETVEALVYFDEFADGVLGPEDNIRIPGVEVHVGGRFATSAASTGIATIAGVATGAQQVTVNEGTLPAFYQPPAPIDIVVPASGQVEVPLTLPIGDEVNRNVYMAFGDSLTGGEGASAGAEYPTVLEGLLRSHFGEARVTNRASQASDSFAAVVRIERNLRGSNPSHTLILYGTNDWNDPACMNAPPCYTPENLRVVVERTKRWRSLPFLATIPPPNPALISPPRNDFYKAVNEELAVIAAEEGAFLVDLHTAFEQAPDTAALFADHIHPNDAGYELIAQTFFEAIAHAVTPSAASVPSFGWRATPE
jgi:lysophospholipase L1-like esterase